MIREMIELQNILSKIIANTNEVFNAEAGSIALLDPSQKQIVIQVAVGAGAEAVKGVSLPVGEGIVGWVISNEQPTIVPNVDRDARFYGAVDEQIGFQTRSIMCVPLQVDNHIIGVMELINIDANHLNDDGLRLLTIFADHAALAIENNYLLTETQHWSEKQALLFESKVEVTADRALETILTMVSQQMIEVLKADLCLISRWDKTRNELRILHSDLQSEFSHLEKIIHSLTSSPLVWALSEQSPRLLKADMPDLPPASLQWLELLNMQAIYLIPLTHHRQVIGLVEIGCSHQTNLLSKDELRLAETMIAQAAAAIEHARLHDETTRRLAETTVLQEVMMAAASTLDFDEILGDTIKALHRTLGIERLAVFLPTNDPQFAQAHPVAIGFPADQLAGGMMVPVTHSSVGWVMERGQPLLLRNVHEANSYFELLPDTQSAMYIPVSSNEQVVAVLSAESPRLNAFAETDLRLFTAIAGELAVALKNANLFQTERQLADQRQALLDIFADLSSELEPKLLFQRIIERAVQVIPHADAGSLIIPHDEVFVYAAAVGFSLKDLQNFTFSRESILQTMPPAQTVQQFSKAELEAISQQNITTPSKYGEFNRFGPQKIESTIQAGLYSGDNILGLLSIDSLSTPAAFTKDDQQTLLLFANQAAIALQNARLFDEVRTAEANYRDLFDNANDFIVILDSNFQITRANKVVLKTTGFSLDEIIGQRVTQFLSPPQLPDLYHIVKTHLGATEAINTFEATIFGKQQQEILLEATIRIRRKNNRPVGIHCIARDITHRRALEKELQQTEKLSAIGKLVAGVAHELNNPLTTVIGYASLLQEDLSPEYDYKADLELIYKHAQRARSIVRDLLKFAQKVNLNPKPININELIQASLIQMRLSLQTHTIQTVINLDDQLPIINGDDHQLEQVFINLLTNACQALSKIDPPRKLVITSKKVGHRVVISFADNGPGIPDHIIHRIFEPFFSTKPMGEGTGLGLSICFGIINEHKGRIWVENQPTGGAVFYIELPIKRRSTDQFKKFVNASTNSSTPHLQILTIDDEQAVLDLLERVLSSLGHTIDLAPDGAIALTKLERHTYDLIICDVVIPKISGIELYKIATERFPKLAKRFMFVTGHASDTKTKEFLEQANLPWLAKPFLPDELEKVIADYAKDFA